MLSKLSVPDRSRAPLCVHFPRRWTTMGTFGETEARSPTYPFSQVRDWAGGYALPRLAERLGFARASIALGMIWASWHLPLFFLTIPGNDDYGQSFLESTPEINARVFFENPASKPRRWALGEAASNWLLPLNPQTNRRSRKYDQGPHGGF